MPPVDNRGNLRGSLQNRVGPNALSQRGASDFLKLSRALKAAGETGLRNDLHNSVANAAKPLIPKVREAGRRELPTTGGLNERIARKPYRAQTRTGVKTAGVRITGSKVDPRINNAGRIGHPVFGRKGKAKNGGRNFVVQTVPAAKGYFDETLQREGPAVREAVVRTLADFTDRIVREAR